MISRFGREEKEALNRVIDSSDKTLSYYSFSYKGEGGEVWKFEKEFARWLGRKYCVAVNSGTSALMVAIRALCVKTDPLLGKNDCVELKHQKISIPAYTFVADAEAVVANDCRINFEDIDRSDYCMNPTLLNPDIAIPVHTLGNVCPPDRFPDLADYIIEDCAQNIGGLYKNKKVGTFGNISMFSGQGTKNLGVGEMGWCCTDNEELAERMYAIRNHSDYYCFTHPKKYKYLQNVLGYNLRATELSAAVARCQLKKLPQFLKSFESNARLIFDLLPYGIRAPYYDSHVTPAWFILGCMYQGKHRHKFLEKLKHERKKAKLTKSVKEADIPGTNESPGRIISQGYGYLLHELPLYQKFKRVTPNADFVRNNVVWFDIHRWNESSYVEKNMEIVNRVYKEIEG